jgi:steroid delta-isomerase-like uncharacterized protein
VPRLEDLTLNQRQSQATPVQQLATRESKFNFSLKGEHPMSEANKAVVIRAIEEIWNKGNLPVADELYTSSYTHHDTSTPDAGPGPEGEKQRASLYRAAFPDLKLKVEDLIAEGKKVILRWTGTGTHKGELAGIAPTGKPIDISGITVVHFTDGRMSEGWVSWDALVMMRQLGVVPEQAKSKAATSTK